MYYFKLFYQYFTQLIDIVMILRWDWVVLGSVGWYWANRPAGLRVV